MDSQQEKTLSMLRGLWSSGNNIFNGIDSENYNERTHAYNIATRWIEEANVCFKNLFYNSKFYEDFSNTLSSAYDNNSLDQKKGVNLLLGHITGLGKMLKHGYLKDQFAGINNEASSKCFVAMSFDEDLEDIFSVGIMPAIKSLGYEAIRVDKVHHNEKIDSKICELINQSRFVVADFTRQRNGVYYEAGYAKGLGLPVVQTCQQTEFDKLHFDIKTIHTIGYSTASKLQILLKEHVEKSIGRYKPAAKAIIDTDNDIPF